VGQLVTTHREGIPEICGPKLRSALGKVPVPIYLLFQRCGGVGGQKEQLRPRIRRNLWEEAGGTLVSLQDDLVLSESQPYLAFGIIYTHMSICSSNSERVDANSLCAVDRECSWFNWNSQPLFGKRNYTISVESPGANNKLDNSLRGLGVMNLMFGGIVLFSRDRMHLIKLLRPEEPSECPTLGFTDPMYTPFRPKTLPTAVVSAGSPVGVPVPWHWGMSAYANIRSAT